MVKLEFDDEMSRVVEEINAAPANIAQRARILQALDLKPGYRVLDVGSGPGHQVFDIASVVGETGHVDGIDPSESANDIARQRCSALDNVKFRVGEAADIPFDDNAFDAVMSSQVFEYLDDVQSGLADMYRVLKPGGRVVIQDVDWGTLLWHSSDPDRMARINAVWDNHLADPHVPQTLARRLKDAGFVNVRAEAVPKIEIEYDPGNISALFIEIYVGYVVSQGVPQQEADAWAADLHALGAADDYFFAITNYIFAADKP